jgi:hypothetical protein
MAVRGRSYAIIREVLLAGEYKRLRELGDLAGITRERARQICVDLARREGIVRPPPPDNRPRCSVCKTVLSGATKSGHCEPCRYKLHTVYMKCHQCGKMKEDRLQNYERRQKDPRYSGRAFCDRVCLGRWLGLKYGFNRGKDGAKRTHCKRGHEFAPENTYTHGRRRQCRKCNALRARRRRTRV